MWAENRVSEGARIHFTVPRWHDELPVESNRKDISNRWLAFGLAVHFVAGRICASLSSRGP